MGTPKPKLDISTRRRRIAELAKQAPDLAFKTLGHHIDLDWMREAYRRTRKDGAPGIDGQTAAEFEEHLEENLQGLIDLAKSGRYRAPSVRRVWIPKASGGQRPLGIPTLADKVLQRAVLMVLEPIYEQDFLNCSYGFRPERSARGAVERLRDEVMRHHGGWIVELDIKGYFDAIDHGQLRDLLRQRIRDGVVLRLIGKWLKAGVLEEGRYSRSESGTPQGGVISPLLANVYLHDVLDTWFEDVVRPRLHGYGAMVRYADDAVLFFEQEDDARRVLAVLPKRFGKYGLELHPEKTRLVRFQRPPRRRGPDKSERLGTFDFLGFTFHWGKSQRGNNVVKLRTASDRFTRSITALRQYCRRMRHVKVRQQWKALCQKLHGHYGYYGVRGNAPALNRFHYEACLTWFKWLQRRSHKAPRTWDWWNRFQQRYPLPRPLIQARALA